MCVSNKLLKSKSIRSTLCSSEGLWVSSWTRTAHQKDSDWKLEFSAKSPFSWEGKPAGNWVNDRSCLHGTPKVQCSEGLQVCRHIHVPEGDRPQFHEDRSSCTPNCPRPNPMHLFTRLVISSTITSARRLVNVKCVHLGSGSCSSKFIKPKERGHRNPRFVAKSDRSCGLTWAPVTCDWHVKWWGQTCRTEPLSCGTWHCGQADSVRTELNCSWCCGELLLHKQFHKQFHKVGAGRESGGLLHIWSPEVSEWSTLCEEERKTEEESLCEEE